MNKVFRKVILPTATFSLSVGSDSELAGCWLTAGEEAVLAGSLARGSDSDLSFL